MPRLIYLLLIILISFYSCKISIETESNQVTRNSNSDFELPDVSAAVAAGDYELVIKDSALPTRADLRTESYFGTHPDSIGFLNVPLKQALAALLDIDTLNLKSNKPLALKQRIDLSFKSKRSDLQNRFIVLDSLSKRYHFSVERSERADWDLVLHDRKRLDEKEVLGTTEQKITTRAWLNNKQLNLEKNKLKNLAEGLSKLWDLKISDQTGDSRYFSLNIEAEDFTGLQKSLSEHGLRLEKSKISGYPGFIRFED